MKKLFCLALAFVMLLALASCASSTVTEQTNPPSANTTEIPVSTEAEETVDPNSVPDIPSTFNFGGEEIVILTSDRSWWKDEISVEAENGEVINDEVWKRNAQIETDFQVKIRNDFVKYDGDNAHVINAIAKTIAGGTREYDIVLGQSYRICMATTKGYFLDLNKIENINLNKTYWMQGYNQAVEFHGAQYSATGAIALSSMRFSFATFFNKALFDDAKIPYLYDAVESGDWTLEYQYSLLSQLYQDVDGNQTQSDGDIFAFITSDMISADPYWASLELSILSRDSNGDYVYSPNTERLTNAIDKLRKIYDNLGTNVIHYQSQDAEQNQMRDTFANGQAAMITLRLMETENDSMREMTAQYGVVPMPKYDKEQQNYHTHVHDQFSVVTVLNYVEEARRPMVGALIETLAYRSSKGVVPAYYDITLKFKYASDSTVYRMLDIIMDGRRVDAGNVYYSEVGSPHAMMRSLLETRTLSVASKLATQSRQTPKAVTKLNENLAKLAN